MILTFTWGHRVMRELKLVRSSCCKVACSGPNILYWLIMSGRWPQRTHENMVNMDHLGIFFSCLTTCIKSLGCLCMNVPVQLFSGRLVQTWSFMLDCQLCTMYWNIWHMLFNRWNCLKRLVILQMVSGCLVRGTQQHGSFGLRKGSWMITVVKAYFLKFSWRWAVWS